MNPPEPSRPAAPRALAATLRRGAAALALVLAALPAAFQGAGSTVASPALRTLAPAAPPGDAEARLAGVQRLVESARLTEAMAQAEQLVADYPNFALARLAWANLLAIRAGGGAPLGDAASAARDAGRERLKELQSEARLRARAWADRPAPGAVPAAFVQLAPGVRHAIAVDTARSRLYVFENTRQGPRLVADYYVSIGREGTSKAVEGDLRTPLGVYHVTSRLDPRRLDDLYGSGALPINYPSAWDSLQGRTGSGIWVHGTPGEQFARAPLATDGCIAVPNPDMVRLAALAEPGRTPVLIGTDLAWTPARGVAAAPGPAGFQRDFQAWHTAKGAGELPRYMGFYAADFRPAGRQSRPWREALEAEARALDGRGVEIKDVSVFHWRDAVAGADVVLAHFGEVPAGRRAGQTKRQYWVKRGAGWQIVAEEVAR
ncbi:MAG: L,D-transpeptidase [Burkholderiales bacterium]|nr:L,D-transpeptidase [Burkholderiales bacterium]